MTSPGSHAACVRRIDVRLALVFALASVLGALLMAIHAAPAKTQPADCRNIVPLELAPDARAFAREFVRCWSTCVASAQAGKSDECEMRRLRRHLFWDSLLFAPGYAGLLGLFGIVMIRAHPAAAAPRWAHHAACLLPVIALLFDLTENGLAMRTAELALARMLPDAALDDLRLASEIKWYAVAAALGVLGGLTLWARPWRADPRRRRGRLLIGAGTSALAAGAALALGVCGRLPSENVGMGLAVIASMLYLAWLAWRWRDRPGTERST